VESSEAMLPLGKQRQIAQKIRKADNKEYNIFKQANSQEFNKVND